MLGLTSIRPLPDAIDAAPLIDAPPCGVLGIACCTGGTCSDGTACSSGRCVAFAGSYEKTNDTSCGAPACIPNAVTGTCGCPANFPAVHSAIDEGCGAPTAPTHLTAQLSLCSISTIPANSEWGGAYVEADIPECEPATSPPGCLMPDAMTGDCTCPAGAENVALRTFVPGTATVNSTCPGTVGQPDFLGGNLHVCLLPVAQPISIAGVFQRDQDGSCRAHSSGLAGCACPAGSVASSVTSIDELGTGFPLTQITFCAITP